MVVVYKTEPENERPTDLLRAANFNAPIGLAGGLSVAILV